MDQRPNEKLLPITILDGMILVAASAVSLWLFRCFGPNSYVHLLPPVDMFDWLLFTAFVQYGPTSAESQRRKDKRAAGIRRSGAARRGPGFPIASRRTHGLGN